MLYYNLCHAALQLLMQGCTAVVVSILCCAAIRCMCPVALTAGLYTIALLSHVHCVQAACVLWLLPQPIQTDG